MNNYLLILLLFLLLVSETWQFYSKYYKKCLLFKSGKEIGSLPTERVGEYLADFGSVEKTVTTKPVEY